MKKLTLMRHAKSSWADSDIPDIERTLGERGRRAADLLGKWLASEGHEPDQVIVSSAARCQETWELVSAGLSNQPDVSTEAGLYMASPEEILNIIRAKATGDNVLVIAHMPGIGSLARALRVDPAPAHAPRQIPYGWHNSAGGSGRLDYDRFRHHASGHVRDTSRSRVTYC